MSDTNTRTDQPIDGRRVRRAYLAYVFAGPAIVGLLGAFLIAIAIFSSQPIPVRVTELPVGALMVIVAVFMPRMSGPLEFSVFRSSFKANLDATLSEALVLAREAAVEVQPQDDPKRDQKAEEAVLKALNAMIVDRTARSRIVSEEDLRVWVQLRLYEHRPFRSWTVGGERRPRGSETETRELPAKHEGEELAPPDDTKK